MAQKQLPPGLYQQNGSWHYRYYERTVGADGSVRTTRPSKKLATLEECPRLCDVEHLYYAEKARETSRPRSTRPTSHMTLSEFWRADYLPWVKATKKPSTQRAYSDMWARHLEPVVGSIRLRDFRKADAISAIEPIAFAKLAQSQVHNARTVLGSIFKRACEKDLVEFNPIRDFQTPQGTPRKRGEAYTAEEAERIIFVLTGRARICAAILAYTGIRPQELAGLDWLDYDGDFLYVRRAVWNGQVVSVKTPDSAAAIPVIRPLRQILDAYRAMTAGISWLICGDTGKPIRLGNIARREVVPVLKANGLPWKGWVGFRRGTSTTLSDDLDASEDQVRSILRHAKNSDTAREHYIVRDGKKRQAVMNRYEDYVEQVRARLKEMQSPHSVV